MTDPEVNPAGGNAPGERAGDDGLEAEGAALSPESRGAGESRPRSVRGQPAWAYFLTPGAILLGSAIIAGSIWWTRGDDD
ncbi:MAG TPA: hypothetical protein VFK32_10285, partial [Tepidiformaceae bacterium]|nr:hypothetical protein [Tepidiformaceae bacterium]